MSADSVRTKPTAREHRSECTAAVSKRKMPRRAPVGRSSAGDQRAGESSFASRPSIRVCPDGSRARRALSHPQGRAHDQTPRGVIKDNSAGREMVRIIEDRNESHRALPPAHSPLVMTCNGPVA